ncbi:MAG: hypothetical protein LC774_09010 [Acidobacteria bacterium]|nr:hypothetical protein [Acidobacteriota bacterium]
MPASETNATREPLPLLLLAGVPGAGKTTVASHLPDAVVVSMDDFYLAVDDPRLPHAGSKPDWDSRQSVRLESLRETLEQLLRGEEVSVPRYDMRRSRPAGSRRLSPRGAVAIVVEGLYVFDLQPAGAGRVSRVLLTSRIPRTLWRRLRRDLREGRYPASEALTQMLRLFRRYRTYDAEEAARCDHVVRHARDWRATAEKIRALTGFWDR